MNHVQPIRDKNMIDRIKEALSTKPRDYVLFILGVNTGLRISDLLKLRAMDVIANGEPLDRVSLREKKTNKAKDFPLSDTAKEAIRNYAKDMDPKSPLFPSKKGSASIGRVQAYRILNEVAKSVGITEKIGTHSLRKTFAYHAYKSGYDIAMIQKLLNHSSPGVTLRYIGIEQDQMDEVYLGLNL